MITLLDKNVPKKTLFLPTNAMSHVISHVYTKVDVLVFKGYVVWLVGAWEGNMIDGIVAGQSINKIAGPRGCNILNVKTCNV